MRPGVYQLLDRRPGLGSAFKEILILVYRALQPVGLLCPLSHLVLHTCAYAQQPQLHLPPHTRAHYRHPNISTNAHADNEQQRGGFSSSPVRDTFTSHNTKTYTPSPITQKVRNHQKREVYMFPELDSNPPRCLCCFPFSPGNEEREEMPFELLLQGVSFRESHPLPPVPQCASPAGSPIRGSLLPRARPRPPGVCAPLPPSPFLRAAAAAAAEEAVPLPFLELDDCCCCVLDEAALRLWIMTSM